MVTLIKIALWNQTKTCKKISIMSITWIQIELSKQLTVKIGELCWWDIKQSMLSKVGFDNFVWLWEFCYERFE